MDKDINLIVEKLQDQLSNYVDRNQFRRGLESIHDIIYNDIYVCQHIMENKHEGDLEKRYFNIIFHAVYAIDRIRRDRRDAEPQRPNDEEEQVFRRPRVDEEKQDSQSDVVVDQVDQMIKDVQNIPVDVRGKLVYGEKVDPDNPHRRSVDKQLAQLDQLVTKQTTVSKNQRRH